MFESIKIKLWDILKEKQVSLAMLYDKKGEILWHRGRAISGRYIHEGQGFSKTYLAKAINNSNPIEEENVIVASKKKGLPESAGILNVKSLIILPVGETFYLYIDSGIKESFSSSDREVFKTLGGLLGEMIQQVKKNEADIGGISGSSDITDQIRETILKYSIEEEPVFLLGETGVGKSHIAELIHRYSGRMGVFFTVHTPSIPANLFESEIFGHKKGAFTDARSDKKGYVDEARGGTLFFDEISEVPLSFQAKLLRFIETQKYLVLGESVEKKADVRIVAATNRDLHKAIEAGEFREDLYYRLQVLEIQIPPLRERREDIKTLVLEKQKFLKGKRIGLGFWEAVLGYEWPGNVRELITVLKRAGIHAGNPVTGKDIQQVICQSQYKKALDSQSIQIETLWAEIKTGRNFWETVKKPFLKRQLNCFEVKKIIEQGLRETDGTYKELIKVFNLPQKDYKKFVNFISVHNIMNQSKDYKN
jgi:two-component system response regulator PilR (NtrC family)